MKKKFYRTKKPMSKKKYEKKFGFGALPPRLKRMKKKILKKRG